MLWMRSLWLVKPPAQGPRVMSPRQGISSRDVMWSALINSGSPGLLELSPVLTPDTPVCTTDTPVPGQHLLTAGPIGRYLIDPNSASNSNSEC